MRMFTHSFSLTRLLDGAKGQRPLAGGNAPGMLFGLQTATKLAAGIARLSGAPSRAHSHFARGPVVFARASLDHRLISIHPPGERTEFPVSLAVTKIATTP